MSNGEETTEFAESLRGLKDRSGQSYGALAARLHVSTSTLHRYCNGDAVPAEYAAVERFARLCGASPEELIALHRRWILADAARRAASGRGGTQRTPAPDGPPGRATARRGPATPTVGKPHAAGQTADPPARAAKAAGAHEAEGRNTDAPDTGPDTTRPGPAAPAAGTPKAAGQTPGPPAQAAEAAQAHEAGRDADSHRHPAGAVRAADPAGRSDRAQDAAGLTADRHDAVGQTAAEGGGEERRSAAGTRGEPHGAERQGADDGPADGSPSPAGPRSPSSTARADHRSPAPMSLDGERSAAEARGSAGPDADPDASPPSGPSTPAGSPAAAPRDGGRPIADGGAPGPAGSGGSRTGRQAGRAAGAAGRGRGSAGRGRLRSVPAVDGAGRRPVGLGAWRSRPWGMVLGAAAAAVLAFTAVEVRSSTGGEQEEAATSPSSPSSARPSATASGIAPSARPTARGELKKDDTADGRGSASPRGGERRGGASASASPAQSGSSGGGSGGGQDDKPGSGTPLTVSTRSHVWENRCDHRYLIDRPPSQVAPPPVEQDAATWASAHGAVHGGTTNVEMTVKGRSESAVVLQALHVRVVGRRTPLAWSSFAMDNGCGGSLTPRAFSVDLDAARPLAVPTDGNDAGEPIPAVRFPYRVSDTDPEVLLVNARTSGCDCSWYLELDWTSGDREGTIRIDDQGAPFRTSGVKGRPEYGYQFEQQGWRRNG
ncbi:MULTISPECIES: helix-turn-helix domain-containing protein [unclassified Streptomyces]|uniref:helix-turn-helix domain-containing protein n=1 Tax=unclassified Streptomyces TaxID=2593676 RepID=UPI00336A7B7F